MRNSITNYTLLIIMMLIASCTPSIDNAPSIPDSDNFHKGTRLNLTFEERMAIRAQLTFITMEAQSESNRIYDKFHSRESAINNEEYADELEKEKKNVLKAEHNLNDSDLNSIIDEYLFHQGVEIQ